MSFPRQVVPGRIYLVTRRCTQRQFLLRPDAETNNAFIYCLAYAAHRAGVRVIAFLASSNHYHAVLVDVDGRIPHFLEDFHRLIAKHQNALRRRSENMWSNQQTSLVELVGDETVLAKTIYTLANPVKDHLVAEAHHWPGASSLRSTMSGKAIVATKPLRFFRRDSLLPSTIELQCARIPGFEHLSDELYAAAIAHEIRQIEIAAAQERQRTGAQVLGRKTARTQSPTDRPSSEPVPRKARAWVASASAWARAEAIARLKMFRITYESARRAWLAGAAGLFPEGTWWLRKFAAVSCDADGLTA